MGYLANFMVYTLAMVGVIAVALLVFRNSGSFGCAGKSKYLKVVDSLSIGPRKTLYIITAGKENFLIAGDVDKTSLISKLESSKPNFAQEEPKSFKEIMNEAPKTDYADKSIIGIKSSLLHEKAGTVPVMRSLASKFEIKE